MPVTLQLIGFPLLYMHIAISDYTSVPSSLPTNILLYPHLYQHIMPVTLQLIRFPLLYMHIAISDYCVLLYPF